MIDPRDDLPHEVGPEQGWAESYAFLFADAGAALGGSARVDLRPNEGVGEGRLHLFLPDGVVATVLTQAECRDVRAPAVESVRCACEEPLVRWRLRCRDTALAFTAPASARRTAGAVARLELDLVFAAATPPVGRAERRVLTEEGSAFVRVSSSGRFDQAAIVRGALRLGEQSRTLAGLGTRERSWGPRGTGAARLTRWFSMPFGEDFAISAATMREADREVPAGWVWRNGRAVAVARLAIEGGIGPRARELRLLVVDAEGGSFEVEGRVPALAPTRADGAQAREGLASYRINGRACYGIAGALESVDVGVTAGGSPP